MHGLALSTHAIWQKWDPLASWRGRRIYSLAGICVSRVLTLGVFLFSIVLFRAPSVRQGFSYWRGMLSWNHHGVRMLSPFILPAIAVVFLVHLFVSKDRNWAQEIPARPLAIRVAACTALVLALAFFGSTDNVPFIYFQF